MGMEWNLLWWRDRDERCENVCVQPGALHWRRKLLPAELLLFLNEARGPGMVGNSEGTGGRHGRYKGADIGSISSFMSIAMGMGAL